MERISLAELSADCEVVDSIAAQTPGVDTFCSSAAWVLAATGTLTPSPTPWFWRGQHGYLTCQRAIHPDGFPYVAPMELMWGLQSAIIGAEPKAIAAEAFATLAAASPDEWAVALWPGMTGDGALVRALRHAAPAKYVMRLGAPTIRHVASLDGGREGFLSRRSRNFVRSITRSERAAKAAGITFEVYGSASVELAHTLFERLISVEDRSWKATEDAGLREGLFRDFYRSMVAYLGPRHRLRLMFARAGDRDVAYSLGVVFAGTYRGLQFSYDDKFAALSLGSLCQLRQIEALAEEPELVTNYDLGTEMDYKRRWAEGHFTTRLVIIQRP